MHAADHTGPGHSAGSGNAGGTEATRYIITRPCLDEGSLRLLKYLQPLFPTDGPVTLQDGKGERFGANVELARGRLTGMGELYRAHNMGVNDVLLLYRAEEGRYRVECVVKPHARPASSLPERPSPPPLTTEKRVVIHATPHVREVRVERVPAESAKPTGRSQEIPARTGRDDAPKNGQKAENSQKPEAAPLSGSHPGGQVSPVQINPVQAGSPQTGAGQPLRNANAGRTTPSGGDVRPTDAPASRSSTPITALTVQMQQHSGAAGRLASVPNLPIQMSFPAPEARAETKNAAPASIRSTGSFAQAAAPMAVQTVAPKVVAREPAKTERPAPAPEARPAALPEDQLAALARLTGYTCDHLGSGVVRLRAELASHSYSVLIATTPQALTTPAWNESCDYMALLTPEHERPQGIPRFTHAALTALIEHARTAPLTPVDLRGYWNTGSFDQESAASVAELVNAQLAQRRNFSHVLETLAQQPAHSLVHLPRLAERLGGGVNTSELHGILETLSRAPFLALTPLPNGQYYLRNEVRDLVQEFGTYAESMQRRLRPGQAPRA